MESLFVMEMVVMVEWYNHQQNINVNKAEEPALQPGYPDTRETTIPTLDRSDRISGIPSDLEFPFSFLLGLCLTTCKV